MIFDEETAYRKRLMGAPPDLEPLQVEVGDNFEEAFKKFKAICQRDRVLGELKERQAYEKPSVKKRRKQKEARERRLMMEARDRMMASGEWDRRQKQKQRKRQEKLEKKLRKQDLIEDYE